MISRRFFLKACGATLAASLVPATGGGTTPRLPELPRSLGRVRIFAADGTLLSSIRLDRRPGGWGGSSSVEMTGTAAYCVWERHGQPPVRGTVGTWGADLTMNSTMLTVGGTVTLTQFIMSCS